MSHQKHAKLRKPEYGEYHRKEFGLIGAPCGEIQKKVASLTPRLSPLRMAYIDADHASADQAENPEYNCWSSLTDKITYRSFQSFREFNRFDHQSMFNDHDLVLINGNHFESQKQIVVVHPGKLESLQRKLKRINDVALILLAGGITEIPDFLKIHLRNKLESIPVGKWDDQTVLADFIKEKLDAPKLKGLVLAGGKSTRMGSDKTIMEFYGKPQREHLYDLMSEICAETYISCRADQSEQIDEAFNTIEDRFLGLGPYGAILSAFQTDPNAAWLVLASDLPLMDKEALNQLVSERDSSRVATAFRSPTMGFPEPLVSIWEPRAYYHLLRFLGLGYSCPRKVLINTNTKVVDALQANVLRNTNTKEELREILKLMERKET